MKITEAEVARSTLVRVHVRLDDDQLEESTYQGRFRPQRVRLTYKHSHDPGWTSWSVTGAVHGRRIRKDGSLGAALTFGITFNSATVAWCWWATAGTDAPPPAWLRLIVLCYLPVDTPPTPCQASAPGQPVGRPTEETLCRAPADGLFCVLHEAYDPIGMGGAS